MAKDSLSEGLVFKQSLSREQAPWAGARAPEGTSLGSLDNAQEGKTSRWTEGMLANGLWGQVRALDLSLNVTASAQRAGLVCLKLCCERGRREGSGELLQVRQESDSGCGGSERCSYCGCTLKLGAQSKGKSQGDSSVGQSSTSDEMLFTKWRQCGAR